MQLELMSDRAKVLNKGGKEAIVTPYGQGIMLLIAITIFPLQVFLLNSANILFTCRLASLTPEVKGLSKYSRFFSLRSNL